MRNPRSTSTGNSKPAEFALNFALGALLLIFVGCADSEAPAPKSILASTEGMIWVEGGTFIMGSVGPLAASDEAPLHQVTVDGFYMDSTEVTNLEFQKFVLATGYVTESEKKPDLAELRKQLAPGDVLPQEDELVAGSVVFLMPRGSKPGTWKFVEGANWRHPYGPASDIKNLMNHPVVHVSWDDARAYARWAKKRLPTEAEWEYVAQKEALFDIPNQSNIWQGQFPNHNAATDGFATTSPVGRFKISQNGFADLAGNVWEWCEDWYRPDTYAKRTEKITKNPRGPNSSWDPQEPNAPKRVLRGGSFLCNIQSCRGYRPSARMKSTPDTGLSHAGFRCVASK